MKRLRRYQWALSQPENISLVYYRWNAILPRIDLSIGFNITFRFLLDLFLCLNLHFDPTLLEWELPNFNIYFEPIMETIPKAKYDETYYDRSIYDPPEVNVTNLERLAWNARYKTTDKAYGIEKNVGPSVSYFLDQLKSFIKNKGVADFYADAIMEQLSYVEGKLIRTAYVGFSVVDISRVAPPKSRDYEFQIRDATDWETYHTLKSKFVYECHVNYARVNYSRVISEDMRINRELVKDLMNRISEFKERTRPLWQGVFFIQRTKQFHRRGGYHQARMGYLAKTVKEILDRRGVFGLVRGAYQSFARELYYYKHKGHKKWKYWKEMLTEDDIINKYVNMGCDESLLREIARVI